jgi:predicted RNA-binding protein YlxR (DUF448 family)
MKQYREILRTCVQSREVCEKKDLFRVVRTPEKNVVVDLKGKANGRGAYLKKDIEIFEKAKKTKILNKILEVEVNDEVYEELSKTI